MFFARLRRTRSEPAPEGVTPELRNFSVTEGCRVYAVGDIHGKGKLLTKLLAAIAQDSANNPATETHEIFLGDYIDRGLESRAVIDQLLDAPPPGHTRHCLMGNHEETLLKFLNEPKILREWGNYGGYATLAAYGIPIPAAVTADTATTIRDQLLQRLPAKHLEFLKNLPLTKLVGDYLFVHAGLHPARPMHEQSREHLLWIRDIFLKHEGYFDAYVVHGHSPVTEPDVRSNRANIDVSHAARPSLCCLVVEGTQRRILLVTDE